MQIDWGWVQSVLVVSVAVGILANFGVKICETIFSHGMGFFSFHRRKTFTHHLIYMRKLASDPIERSSFFHFHWSDLAFNAFGALVSTIAFFALSGRQLKWPTPDLASWLLTAFALLVLMSVANVLRQIWNIRVSALWLHDFERAEAWFLKTFGAFPDGYLPLFTSSEKGSGGPVEASPPARTKARRAIKGRSAAATSVSSSD
ncbi:hypothetical protein [Devosia sp. XK-2]|uniref:hypothetical protein n=1 Tax=Devosia sp. XK-2 TaxID=3126689 RepID=UPI0030D2ADCA